MDIKFMAWDAKNKMMIPCDNVGWGIDFQGNVSVINSEGVWEGYEYSKHIKLMQYIGMNDKNGKEIYKDFIVLVNDDETGVVVWNEDELEYAIAIDNVLTKTGCYYPKELEVIGSIYENPEMLKGN